MIENFRKNSIEFRTAKNFISEEPYYEIVRYQKNPWYNKQQDFEVTILGEYRHKTDGYYVSESLFHKEESMYTLAIFIVNEDEIEPDLKTVAGRPFELTDEEMLDFAEVARYGFKEITNENREKYNQ